MRTSLLARLLIALCAVGVTACGGEPEEAKTPAKKADKKAAKKTAKKKAPPKKPAKPAPEFELAPVEIAYEDFKAVMQAPKGATFKEQFGTLNVKLGEGKDFWVQIDVEAPDLTQRKAAAEKNTVQKLVKVHTESADTLIYETKAFGRTSFWLDAAVRVGARTVHCYSGRGGSSYSEGQIKVFEAACKSLKLKR